MNKFFYNFYQSLNIHLFFLLFILASCAYFNTFYNAESAYKKALQIIEETPNSLDEKLPSQADKLLVDAIQNSKLVISDFPSSKFIDDAIFIIAKASFLKGEITVAEKHFNMILEIYPESKYYNDSEIWLAYTHLRMGMIDSCINQINKIQSQNPTKNEHLYIIHNVLAEVAIERDSLEQIYYHYEVAAEYAMTNSKKTLIYGKLTELAENENDKFRASIYLEELGKVAPDKIRLDSKLEWITYQRELGEYDNIIDQINSLLSQSEFQNVYIQLELELAKVYLDINDFSTSKEIFLQMVETYSKKNETAEAYYHLGKIVLLDDFNLDLAKEYLEKSKNEKSMSKYGRKSKELNNKIIRYENLEIQYRDMANKTIDEESIKNDIDEEYNSHFTDPDSLLFIIGEMLLYDFHHLDRSMDKFKLLAEIYPNSRYAPQALYVLSHFEPQNKWSEKLALDFPESNFNQDSFKSDTTVLFSGIKLKRDHAWSQAEFSYEKAYKEFYNLFKKESDTLSLYITGFINDVYLNDLESSVKYYQQYINKYPEHYYAEIVEDRLRQIKQDLEYLKDLSTQGIEYHDSVTYLRDQHNYDSVKVLLQNIVEGIDSKYKIASKQLIAALDSYNKIKSALYIQNTIDGDSINSNFIIENKDSLFYEMAILFEQQLDFPDSAKLYYLKKIDLFKESDFRYNSLLNLSIIDKSDVWMEQLKEEYTEEISTSQPLDVKSIYLSDILEDEFPSQMQSVISDCEKYLLLFPESVDSTDINIIPDSTSLQLNIDSTSQVKTDVK